MTIFSFLSLVPLSRAMISAHARSKLAKTGAGKNDNVPVARGNFEKDFELLPIYTKNAPVVIETVRKYTDDAKTFTTVSTLELRRNPR